MVCKANVCKTSVGAPGSRDVLGLLGHGGTYSYMPPWLGQER